MTINKFNELQKKEIDTLFDETLRPLWSKSARTIFKVIIDSNQSHLTTMDIQNSLKKYELKLSKKEINNWLTSLQESKFVSKETERGKPTTIEYKGRYTFDLWKITENGYEIAEKISNFLNKYPYLNGENIGERTRFPELQDLVGNDLSKIEAYYYMIKILICLFGNRDKVDSIYMSKNLGIRHDHLINALNKYDCYQDKIIYALEEKQMGVIKKIIACLGVRPKKTYYVKLTEWGGKIAKTLHSLSKLL